MLETNEFEGMKKIKVIHVIPSLAKGGAERIVLDSCIELSKRKEIEICLVTFYTKNEYFFLSESINHKVIESNVTPSFMGKHKINTAELQNFIEKYQPDIIHLHLFESIMVFSQVTYSQAKYIIHFHNNIPQFSSFDFKQKLTKKIATNLYEKYLVIKKIKKLKTTFIAISQNSFNYITNNVPKYFEKKLLQNAIDLNRFNSNSIAKENRLITIGSLLINKNHQLCIDVVFELHKCGYKIFLDILGDGPEYDVLLKKIKDYKLENFITLYGKVDFPEHYLKQASIYLHTAINEAFGLVLIEAMAAGLPVICTDAGGNRDIIENGKNGFIFKSRNPTEIANKIIELLNNDSKRIEMGNYARQFAQKYDIKNYVDELIKIYKV